MKQLKEDLKNARYKKVYLLYGEERYLVQYYEQVLTDQLLAPADALMNRDVFNGKEVPVPQIMDAANTLPFLSDKRLVYARDTQLFTAGRKADTEDMSDYLSQLPESTVLVFIETEVDKRNRLYKKVMSLGQAAEMKTPSEKELFAWVVKVFQKKGKQIGSEAVICLLRTVSHRMSAVAAEAEKLSAYSGTRTEITAEDIAAVCSPSLESRIFDLVAAVGNRRAEEALLKYRHMLLLKEQPLMILAMMARQFRMILQCKACAEKGMNRHAMTEALSLRSFMVSECLSQGRHFSLTRLTKALRDCHEMDVRIKTGLMDAETGVALLISRYAAIA